MVGHGPLSQKRAARSTERGTRGVMTASRGHQSSGWAPVTSLRRRREDSRDDRDLRPLRAPRCRCSGGRQELAACRVPGPDVIPAVIAESVSNYPVVCPTRRQFYMLFKARPARCSDLVHRYSDPRTPAGYNRRPGPPKEGPADQTARQKVVGHDPLSQKRAARSTERGTRGVMTASRGHQSSGRAPDTSLRRRREDSRDAPM